MKWSQRWNNLQICPHRDSNTGGSDLWAHTLPLDHWCKIIRSILNWYKLINLWCFILNISCDQPETWLMAATSTLVIVSDKVDWQKSMMIVFCEYSLRTVWPREFTQVLLQAVWNCAFFAENFVMYQLVSITDLRKAPNNSGNDWVVLTLEGSMDSRFSQDFVYNCLYYCISNITCIYVCMCACTRTHRYSAIYYGIFYTLIKWSDILFCYLDFNMWTTQSHTNFRLNFNFTLLPETLPLMRCLYSVMFMSSSFTL